MTTLFEPLKIGSMEIKNRTFMAPMSLGYESQDGTINETLEAYFLRRAEGGVGCIITDALSVDPATPYLGNTLCFRSEESILKYKEFTDKVHAYGTKVIPQITHPGPESISSFFGVTPVASSAYVNSLGQSVRALTLEEISGIIEKYALASYQAKMAGFDGIELHCAHGYMLLGSFLSPMRNKRTDMYGGSLDNRARLLFEVIDAIKEKCGKDFPIILRISGSEKNPQGNTVDDIIYLVPKLIEHGIDAFEISGGTQYEKPNKIIPCHGEVEGLNIPEAKKIKKVSSVPVIVVGKNNDPRRAMNYIEKGLVDGVVFGRALIADPDFVNKAEEGKYDEIAPCCACVVGCVGEQTKRRPASCVINPFVGKEAHMKIEPAEHPKKVAVIGGGIGGMACARILKMRGHDVTVYEKENQPGGQMNLACVPPHKQELSKWIVYLNNELNRLDVKVVLNKEISEADIENLGADEIVLATGAKPFVPNIEGVDENPITAHDILKNKTNILGGNVLVVGGGMVGMEVCETLHHRAMGPLNVTMIEMSDTIGAGLAVNNLKPEMIRLRENNVKMMTNCKLVKIDTEGVHVEHYGQSEILRGITHVVYACGVKPVNNLVKEYNIPLHSIGDCLNPVQALEAVKQGVEVALEI